MYSMHSIREMAGSEDQPLMIRGDVAFMSGPASSPDPRNCDLLPQGDLLHPSGRSFTPAVRSVFARFSGCNLWSGREVDRAQAICTFCDTDFIGTDGPEEASSRI